VNYRPTHSYCWEDDGHLILETITRHKRDKKVIGSDQHGFTKVKSYIAQFIAFCD